MLFHWKMLSPLIPPLCTGEEFTSIFWFPENHLKYWPIPNWNWDFRIGKIDYERKNAKENLKSRDFYVRKLNMLMNNGYVKSVWQRCEAALKALVFQNKVHLRYFQKVVRGCPPRLYLSVYSRFNQGLNSK